jgi:pyruvate/2-oxoacid:ferredoxin oxidoreductase beta subunit
VAQTTAAHINHFYRAIIDANSFPGPAVVIAYTTCQPEHGVGDDRAAAQARLAVDSRAFPLFVHDPRKGERIAERLSLQGNPDPKEDWHRRSQTGEVVTSSLSPAPRSLPGSSTPRVPHWRSPLADRLANW